MRLFLSFFSGFLHSRSRLKLHLVRNLITENFLFSLQTKKTNKSYTGERGDKRADSLKLIKSKHQEKTSKECIKRVQPRNKKKMQRKINRINVTQESIKMLIKDVFSSFSVA